MLQDSYWCSVLIAYVKDKEESRNAAASGKK